MADSSPLAHSPTLASATARVPSDDEQLAAGTAVGEYVVERFIGSGAMGEVYAGRHPVIGKRVALKILRHELAASSEAAERFIREARAVNQIEHENVVDVFAFGRLDDGRLYLVMDLVDGRSLRAHLVDGALPIARALDILDPVASALDAAHARGVVHRDLKPDNIVLSNATPSKVMVLDFGIAKLISKANEGKPAAPGTLTGAGTWLGTPGYMAPEQWSVDGAGPASDRYALGVIAFELLAGAPPFSANSVPAMMEQHFRAEVPALAARGAVDVPPAVDKVLAKALAKDPDARYSTAREMVAALRVAAADAAGARAAVAPPAETTRKPWLPAIAGVALLGGAVAVVVLMRSERAQTETRTNANVAPPPGSVTLDVLSMPSGAEVRTSTGMLRTTPAQLVAQPGETIELDVRKPGYASEHRTVRAGPSGAVVQVSLAEITRFQGTWRLANGELRHFTRRGEEVDVFKLRELAGAREFFKTYRFGLADTGVAFGADETVIDPRAPSEPSCHVRVRVDYFYDPMHDVLEQRREHVNVGFADGTCFVESRKIEPSVLARVGETAETHEIAAPVGTPVVDKPKKPPTKQAKTVIPLDPIAAEKKQKASRKTQVTSGPPKLQKKAPPSKNAKSDPFDLGDAAGNASVGEKPTQTYTPPAQSAAPAQNAAEPAPQAADPEQIRKK